ncbi:MAG: nitroreductase family protein [Thermoplasmata archaeon]|nr:MAG: nitroreductase family protein [Thermoplasmata archaeon]
MGVFDAIKGRRSIRKFLSKNIDDETVVFLLECANLAPSAGNLQARDFIVVRNSEIKKELARAAYGQEFVAEAPVTVVFCANFSRIAPYGKRGVELYCIQDVSAAVENFLLAAHALGLGTCWVGAFDEERVSEILSLKDDQRPLAIVPIGYPAEKPKGRGRIDIKRIIAWI